MSKNFSETRETFGYLRVEYFKPIPSHLSFHTPSTFDFFFVLSVVIFLKILIMSTPIQFIRISHFSMEQNVFFSLQFYLICHFRRYSLSLYTYIPHSLLLERTKNGFIFKKLYFFLSIFFCLNTWLLLVSTFSVLPTKLIRQFKMPLLLWMTRISISDKTNLVNCYLRKEE